ncbi:hypothetical protein NHX12_025653 [Muraenolepis orangiensis]|uniref:Uncharacterized protein n=1 Tax=Muraenolepis orangiensis TaxID=630683 RepID=A0A9Q0IML5_9TELE|nr:hypothetical protein NHX12_025653 [Muraenolepis orangiensis]
MLFTDPLIIPAVRSTPPGPLCLSITPVTSQIPGVSGVGRRALAPRPTPPVSFQSQGETGVSGYPELALITIPSVIGVSK